MEKGVGPCGPYGKSLLRRSVGRPVRGVGIALQECQELTWAVPPRLRAIWYMSFGAVEPDCVEEHCGGVAGAFHNSLGRGAGHQRRLQPRFSGDVGGGWGRSGEGLPSRAIRCGRGRGGEGG